MRISDWSSDVCSSDLREAGAALPLPPPARAASDPADRQRRSATRASARFRFPSARKPASIWILSPSIHEMSYYHDDITMLRAKFNQSRSEEHTSELQSLMRTSYAVFCLQKKKHTQLITK